MFLFAQNKHLNWHFNLRINLPRKKPSKITPSKLIFQIGCSYDLNQLGIYYRELVLHHHILITLFGAGLIESVKLVRNRP